MALLSWKRPLPGTQQAMSKKPDGQFDKSKDPGKIWCPDKDGFQYIEACNKNCRGKDKCMALRNYLEPKLFS
jgi:hypothetical protein